MKNNAAERKQDTSSFGKEVTMWPFTENISGKKEPRYFNTGLKSESETASFLKSPKKGLQSYASYFSYSSAYL